MYGTNPTPMLPIFRRTAYLDQAVSKVIANICRDDEVDNKTLTLTTKRTCSIKIRLIVMGGVSMIYVS